MPYENDSVSTEEFAHLLSVIDDLIDTYDDHNTVIGGDFNVGSSRDWVHTALLNGFCDSIGLSPIVRHSKCSIDYSYNFNMNRFSILDNLLLPGSLFNRCVIGAFALHSVDNTSDHVPICVGLDLDTRYVAFSQRISTLSIRYLHSCRCD